MGGTQSAPLETEEERNLAANEPVPKVKLYAFNSENGAWRVVSSDARPEFYDADEDKENSEEVQWMLDIGAEVSVSVSDDMQMIEDATEPRITFVAQGVYAMKFPDKSLCKSFVDTFNDKIFENCYQMEANEKNKEKVYGKDYVDWAGGVDAEDHAFGDFMDMSDINMAQPPPQNYSERKSLAGPRSETATQLETGANRNSYLVRGDTVDVLKNVEDGVEDENISIKISDQSSNYFTPSKVMLARGERDMLIMTPEVNGQSKRNSLFQMDIECGKVVSEWNFNKDGVEIPMRDVHHDHKAGQLESRDTFLGLDDNRLCRWDMRVAGGVVQDMASPAALGYQTGHDFSRGTGFRCLATAGDGSIVVGSADGKIRLYNDRSMRQAKTSFPGLGAPILDVDVTYDGRWVLATTKNYLLLLSTMFHDEKSGELACGFHKRMGNRAAAPRLLKLLPHDAEMAGGKPLSKGKFTWVTDEAKQERWVVASCGKFSVLWSFQDIRSSQEAKSHGLMTCTKYKIIPKGETVVESSFMHDNFVRNEDASQLLVATEHDLYTVSGTQG